jgi:hypothetical protein
MADTTNPVNPVASTTTSAPTSSDLPVINLDALQSQDVQTQEETKQLVDTPVEATQSASEISQTTDTAPSLETTTTEVQINTESTTVEDPFEGLNIVLGEATSNEPWSETIKAAQSFVDPFLNPKKTETSETTTSTEANIAWKSTVSESVTTEATNSSSEPINLDAMLASVDSSTSVITPSINWLSDKKRKMIMIGSWVLGLIVLAAASYFVFSTMYPSGMWLTADISGDTQWTTATWSNTWTESLPDPVAAENVYKPDTTTTPEVDPNSVDNNSVKEEELPTTPAESFGKEDELPIGNTETKPEEKKPDANITSTGTNEEELPSDVKPEVSKAIEDLNRKIEWAKQLLTLLRTKPNPEQTKELAWIIKEIKSILTKLNNNGFTSFSEEIEKPMTDLGFRYDKLTTAIVGN